MSRRVASILLVLVTALSTRPGSTQAAANNEDPAFTSAVYLLRSSTQVVRSGRHILLIKALRHLSDPGLAPLFESLITSPSDTLKIHGVLGLADVAPEHKLDLVRIAGFHDASLQAEIFGAALDNEALTDEQAIQIVSWPDIDPAVKILVAAPLVKAGKLNAPDVLKEAAKSDVLARRALAHMLQAQLGDALALAELRRMGQLTDPSRDATRLMLCRTALRYEFANLAGWALEVANEPGISVRVSIPALQVAMRFGAEGANEAWKRQYESTADQAERTRLALAALRLAPHLDPTVFDAMSGETDPVLLAIGKAGRAVASRTAIAESVVALVEQNHPLANGWALAYAKIDAAPTDGNAILMSLILAVQQAPEKGRAQRAEYAVSATQVMFEANPQSAARMLAPLLTAEDTDEILRQSIILGLIQSRIPAAADLVKDIPFKDLNTRGLALLLRARYAKQMTPDELSDLALLVRGGGKYEETLRMQAAWSYLRLTNRTQPALQAALGK